MCDEIRPEESVSTNKKSNTHRIINIDLLEISDKKAVGKRSKRHVSRLLSLSNLKY